MDLGQETAETESDVSDLIHFPVSCPEDYGHGITVGGRDRG